MERKPSDEKVRFCIMFAILIVVATILLNVADRIVMWALGVQ